MKPNALMDMQAMQAAQMGAPGEEGAPPPLPGAGSDAEPPPDVEVPPFQVQ